MTSSSSKPHHVVIVGGGISGLSIAVRLSQAGFWVTLLESSHLGFGASTRNQGWLYSGAWFAPKSTPLAQQCYQSLTQTLAFCPACLEPNHAGMIFLLAEDRQRSDHWTSAWAKAGIPFESLDAKAALAAIPHWDPQKIYAAWRLPDRAIRTEILLSHLAKVAKDHGAEIQTGTAVAGLVKKDDRVTGLVVASGEEFAADLSILATGGEPTLQSEASIKAAGEQPCYHLVNLKTHLIAVEPGLCPQPFCVLDRGGFNHVPHTSTSVFGSNHWTVVSRSHDAVVERSEIQRITNGINDLLPTWDFSRSEVVEWAGTTAQAMHLDPIESGRVTLPTVIDHETEPGGWKNLLSVFPGRASLWPQLAEMALAAVEQKLGTSEAAIAEPPWHRGSS